MAFGSPGVVADRINFLFAGSMLLWESFAEKISLPLTRLSLFCERGLLPLVIRVVNLHISEVSLFVNKSIGNRG
jgi:hypothetical protein